MSYSRIAGTGSYLPRQVVTNDALAEKVDTSHEWIVERTGIHQRHVASADENTAFIAQAAARKALEAASLSPEAVDLIIVATSTPEKLVPSTACHVQEALGIADCPAFDINAVCSGFTYALSVADRFIRTGGARCALVIGAEIFTRLLDWKDRSTCVLFGDGAGAVVLTPSETPGILSTHLHAAGQHKDLLYATFPQLLENGYLSRPYIKMQGNSVFKIAVNSLEQLVIDTLAANNMAKSDLKWLVPHQANLRIIGAIAKKLEMSMDQVIVTVDKHANTSAASVPLALDVGVRDGRIQRGDTVLLESFGAGMTWGSALMVY